VVVFWSPASTSKGAAGVRERLLVNRVNIWFHSSQFATPKTKIGMGEPMLAAFAGFAGMLEGISRIPALEKVI